MKAACAILLCLCSLAGCGVLPALLPAGGISPDDFPAACETVFPRQKWRLVHSVAARLPGGKQAVLMGVTVIAPQSRRLACVMLSLEGLVLFDASWDGSRLTVRRAIPPFDGDAFARGMIADIQLLFFGPEGRLASSGFQADGAPVCRFRTADGGYQDIVQTGEDRFELRRYDSRKRLQRWVAAQDVLPRSAGSPDRIAQTMRLNKTGPGGYQLNLSLLKAEALASGEELP